MNQLISAQAKSSNVISKEYLFSILRKEYLLIIAILLASITSCVSLPSASYINFKMLITLFNLMIVVAGLRELKVLDFIATSLLSKCKTSRNVSATLIFITFFAAMIMTNDVSLLTFIPITLIIAEKVNIKVMKTVMFQTLAANLGSSIMPMGNPHNIYIYNLYNINPIEFFKITLPLGIFGVIFLTFLIFNQKNEKLQFKLEKVEITNKNQLIFYALLMMVTLLSVFRVIDYQIAFIITVLTILMINKKLFMKVDYSLIITFIGFFIFIGNISHMTVVETFMKSILSGGLTTYFAGIISCQFISNVPTTILLSGFTNHYSELLIATNIGGLGTLIASMANTISYRLYVNQHKTETFKYLKVFSIYNFIGLAIFTIIMIFFNFMNISI